MRSMKWMLPALLLLLLAACGKDAVDTTSATAETNGQAVETVKELVAETSGNAFEDQTVEAGKAEEQTGTESKTEQNTSTQVTMQTEKETQKTAATEKAVSEETVTEKTVPEEKVTEDTVSETRSDHEKEEYERLMSRKTAEIELPRTAENPYNSKNYPDLPLIADTDIDEIDQYLEWVSDVSTASSQLVKTAQLAWFGDVTLSQVVCNDNDTPEVLSTEVQTGNELIDPVMREAGYRNCQITYSYTFGIWKQDGKVRPFLAQLLIDGNEYDYYYGNDELLYRVGPEGEQYAPETDNFMNSIWKIGCYYGETLYGSKEYSDLTVYSMDRIKEYESFVVLEAVWDGRTDSEEFVIDRNTVFAKDAGAFFEGRSAGDTPLDWVKKQLKKTRSSEEADNSLLGVYRVRRTGAHIDELVDLYWWD